ncbi:hypothetical protein ASF61_00275 [Duganella sp. Leaf126]|uniref:hypothetical protein n=1 Tax=Duganella sp. Leaf126 TaxID=1736266 RepID=UPI0006F6C0C8|nr:hypothetical protein [Duganella sp. Leaf126]KQQ47135.1 hypothetical protein ASF61_00275 [Duganella sp. Leaf126]
MSFSDDTLTAYADGQLDATTRGAIEHAMRRDSSLARRVAHLRAQRAVAIDQAQPASRAVQGPQGQHGQHGPRTQQPHQSHAARKAHIAPNPAQSRQAQVVHLAAIRAQRVAVQQAARKAQAQAHAHAQAQTQAHTQLLAPHWRWRVWAALGLALVAGVLVGRYVLVYWQPAWLGEPPVAPTTVISRNGMLVAQGKLDLALSRQSGGAAPSKGDVRVGLSFLSNQGGYCRTFTLVGLSQDLVGLACRTSEEWRVPVLVQNMRPAPPMAAPQPGAEMPTAVLEAIDQRIVGGMMDARAEQEALRRNWQR